MSELEVSPSLSACAGTLLDRHLSMCKEWFPHELVPWSRGRTFEPGAPADETWLPAGVQSALFVNLLTEDNLPHYFHVLARAFDRDSPMGEWVRRWTAEEQRHAIVIRDWICVTRPIDLVGLERARMVQVSTGFRSAAREATLGDGLVYLALQEAATRISHRNTGLLLDDDAGAKIMKRVAADENLHALFYRDMVSAALAEDPSEMVMAIERQVTAFEMPGSGIVGFAAHAAAIAGAGIYDLRVHYEQILVPMVLRCWGLESLGGLTVPAEEARDRTMRWLGRLRRVAAKLDA